MPNNLPVQPTPFMGRTGELGEIIALLSSFDRRLLTVLGHGGSGKTRIAIQAAAESSASYTGGVWFIPLESVSTPVGIVARIAGCMSVSFSAGGKEEEQLFSALAGREALLVLDNFEHLTRHAPLVSRMLSACSGLRFVVTSRRRLGIRGESVYDLSGMTIPHGNDDELEMFDSTSLFLETARRVLPSFSPDSEDRRAIRETCSILQGLPLAIELAAPWVRIIPCRELLAEIRRDLNLLESQSTDVPQRQRSLNAVFEYSWNLLSDGERSALEAMSIFEDGFDRNAASEVASCHIQTIQSLSESSLLKRRAGGGFMLHPLTRQFAMERLSLDPGRMKGLEEAHSAHFARFLDECYAEVHSDGQAMALDRIAFELPNLMKGASWAFGNAESGTMSTYARTLSVLFQLRSRFNEAIEFFGSMITVFEKAALEGPCEERNVSKIRAELRERLGTFHLLTGNHIAAIPCLSEAARYSFGIDDPILEALCLAGLGNAAHLQGELDRALEFWTRALSLSRANGIEKSVTSLLCNIASVRKHRGEFAEARRLLEEAWEINRNTGNSYITASLLSNIAEILFSEGELDRAEEHHRRSLSLRRELGDRRGVSYSLEKLSRLAEERSPAEALELARESVVCIGEGGGNRRVYAMLQLVRALAVTGNEEEANECLLNAEDQAVKLELPSLDAKCLETRAFITALGGTANGP